MKVAFAWERVSFAWGSLNRVAAGEPESIEPWRAEKAVFEVKHAVSRLDDEVRQARREFRQVLEEAGSQGQDAGSEMPKSSFGLYAL